MLAQIADTAGLQNYYRAGYAIIRQYCPQCFIIINPREFELTGSQWQFFMSAAPYYKVLQDLHRYPLPSVHPDPTRHPDADADSPVYARQQTQHHQHEC